MASLVVHKTSSGTTSKHAKLSTKITHTIGKYDIVFHLLLPSQLKPILFLLHSTASDTHPKQDIDNISFTEDGNTIVSDLDYKHDIDKQYNALFSGWTASIVFPAYVNEVFDLHCDILQFVGSLQYRHQLTSVRFCSSQYPVHNGFSGPGFKNLVNDLCRVCVDNGFNVAKNGLYPYTNHLKEKCKAQRLSCSHTFIYRGNTTLRSQEQYRKITYHGNRKNSRGKKGLYMKRRSNSSRSFCNDSTCSFFSCLHLITDLFLQSMDQVTSHT